MSERWSTERDKLIEQLRQNPSGSGWCRLHTQLIDSILVSIWNETIGDAANNFNFTLGAVGGYGREELAPWSDIDIVLYPNQVVQSIDDRFVRELFKRSHDVIGGELGLQIGYSYLLPGSIAGSDSKTIASLMDCRVVAGRPDGANEILDQLWASLPPAEFIIAKQEERRGMMRRVNTTPLSVSPNLKDGSGGLRAFHTACWIGSAMGDRPPRPPKEYDTILMVRNLLHAHAGRPKDELTPQAREGVAELMKCRPDELASEVCSALVVLDREERMATERIHEARFHITDNVLALRGEVRITAEADAGEAAFALSLAHKLGLPAADIPSQVRTGVKAAQAIPAIAAGAETLRLMDRCGVLNVILPEVTDCRTLIPQEPVHEFTVFEHTLRAVESLDSLKSGSFLSDLKLGLVDLGPLYLALLLHDVGKIDPEQDHCDLGAEMAAGICERWGVYAATRELVVWLIKNHLLLSRFIHYRDPANPKTAQELAAEVESADRLVNLTLLTWADASNVGAGVWTPVQMTRMEELVKRTLPLLTQEQESTPDAVELRQRHVRRLSKEDVDETELQNFIESLPTEAIVAPPTEILRLYQVYKEAVENEAAVVSQPIPDVGVTEFTICGADRKGFLTEILAVLYAYDLSIHAVKAATTSESKPYAIDTLKVSSGARSLNPRTADRVSTALKDVLKGTRRGVDLLRDSGKDPGRVQEIFSWRLHSGPIAILEVDAPRGRGMAYRMSSLIKEAGWNIVAARVGQWAGRGAGAFYIEHPSGQPISKADVQGAFDQPKV